MKKSILFVGSKFIYNKALQNYVVREIEKQISFINSITFFKENDNSLFLYLEEELNKENIIIIITTKHNFSTVGKLICTVTSDNQIFKYNILIPQKSSIYEEGSYLLEYNNATINVLHIDEMQEMPKILLHKEENSSQSINIFEEDKETLDLILTPLAQTYDVMIETIVIVEGWIEVEVTSKKHGNISKFITATKQLLPKKLILFANVIEHIIKRLSDAQKKISFAESCTGGLLSYYFTKNNGVSSVFDGSLITYSNELKQNWLGIVSDILEINGAVSPEVVHEMSNGVINVSEADYAISISGIAGEGGGTPEKPVGTVYIGIKTKEMDKEVLLNLKGDRNYIQHQSSLYAIKILLLSDKSMFF